jgi:hypothetical protein
MNTLAAPFQSTRLFEDDYHARIAIPALCREVGYKEEFSDHDEKHNSSFDSLGSVNGDPCFIEVKLNVRMAEMRHIGAKLNEGFRRFADITDTSVFTSAMRAICPTGVTPLFGTIALDYGKAALDNLVELLRHESERLHFAWTVWECSIDGALKTLVSDTKRLGTSRGNVVMPERVVPPRANRKPPVPLSLHAMKAEAAGGGGLFDFAVKLFEKSGCQLKSNARFLSGQVHGVHVRIYGEGSSAKDGLLLGIDKNHKDLIHNTGLGIVGFGDFGHPNFRVQNEGEINSFVETLARSKLPGQYQTGANHG